MTKPSKPSTSKPAKKAAPAQKKAAPAKKPGDRPDTGRKETRAR